METKKHAEYKFEDAIIYKMEEHSLQDDLKQYLKFQLFVSGSGNVKVNDKFYSVIPPAILCSFNQSIDYAITGKVCVYNLYFSPKLINSTFDLGVFEKDLQQLEGNQQLDIYWVFPFIKSCGLMLIGPTTAKRIVEIMEAVVKELEEKSGMYWPCRARSYLYELLNLIHLAMDSGANKMEWESSNLIDSEIQNVISYINENYHRKITIPEICKLFAINRTTLSQKFKKSTNTTIINYLTKLRIHIACVFLRDTTLLVYEIMHRVGYEDTTHFTRAFRKYTNLSPKEYREQHLSATS